MWKSDDPDEKKILYVQTHGKNDPERTATPFFLATAAAAMDRARRVSSRPSLHGLRTARPPKR